MTNLRPDTILKRANGVTINLDSSQDIKISINNSSFFCSNHSLTILNVFAQPISINEALKKLHSIGVLDWIELTGTIEMLYKFGALREPSEIQFVADKGIWQFGSALAHVSMLNDHIRTESFIKAISEVVTEGDVVVDIGTGTGVLAIAAARAGASKVYAIEAGAMFDVAQKIINNTEVAEKITLIPGWSTQIELPETADVLVSEIIGNDPFGERVLQIFKDARQRLLKPDARIVPHKVRSFGLPVSIPPALLKNKVVTGRDLKSWKRLYNVDFSSLSQNTDYQSRPILNLKTAEASKLKILGEPLLLADIDFLLFQELSVQNSATSTIKQNGLLNGLLIYFELDLDSRVISTHPRVANTTNSWRNPVWYLQDTENLQIGDSFTVKFFYNDSGKSSEVRFIN